MNKLSFLHTHYLPKELADEVDIETSIVALESYPDLLLQYYDDYDIFRSLEECILWHSEKYAKKSIKFTIENIAILKNLRSLKPAKDLGLEVVQLFHSQDNPFYDKKNGLSEQGYDLLHELSKNDIILDLSHLNDHEITHVLDKYDGRLIVSHCVCSDLIETIHPRTNALSSHTIEKLSDRGCLFGIPFVNDIVSKISHDTYENDFKIINDIISQIVYFAKNFGAESVALGPDFMDMNYFSRVFKQNIKIPSPLYKASGYTMMWSILKENNISMNDISFIMTGNVKRVIARKF